MFINIYYNYVQLQPFNINDCHEKKLYCIVNSDAAFTVSQPPCNVDMKRMVSLSERQ